CYCRGTVEEKPIEVAANTARNSLLWFNGQVSDIYAILTRYEGVQFGHGMLEPEVQMGRASGESEVLLSDVSSLVLFSCFGFKVPGKKAKANNGVIVAIGQGGEG